MPSTVQGRAALSALVSAVFVLAGCGGGGGSSPAPAPAPTAPAPEPTNQSLSGKVIDGPIAGATVCLDLNKNGTCDSGEPVSGSTDSEGRYTITGLTASQVASDAPLIAVVPVGAVDAVNGTVATAYTMRSPAGKPAVISPVTTMVQTGVTQGMTRPASEAAVAAQLQVNAGSLYNDFSASSAGDNAALATIVPTIVGLLQSGTALEVAAPAIGTPGYTVRDLNFIDSSNYSLRYYYTDNVPDASGLYSYFDERVGVASGQPTNVNSQYDSALYATPTGWTRFFGNVPNTITAGNPYVNNHGGFLYNSTGSEIDVSGQPIADVVRMAQDLSVNTYSTIRGVNAAALSGTMPDGAKLRRSTITNTATPVMYRVSGGTVSNATTLNELVTAHPEPATPTPTNTASMGLLHFTFTCTGVCSKEALRVAFGPSNRASFYLCDYDPVARVQSNCSGAGSGSYALGTAADGATPIMTFSGLPSAASVQTWTRVFIQRNGAIYYGWQDKPAATFTNTRLNAVAFQALAQVLGITPPVVAPVRSPYAGFWNANYSGSDTGSCASVAIYGSGYLNGSCTSTGLGGNFLVAGYVGATGDASFNSVGGSSSGAVFTGLFTGNTASGNWTQTAFGRSGTWAATKQ